jgi:hypothetical protein
MVRQASERKNHGQKPAEISGFAPYAISRSSTDRPVVGGLLSESERRFHAVALFYEHHGGYLHEFDSLSLAEQAAAGKKVYEAITLRAKNGDRAAQRFLSLVEDHLSAPVISEQSLLQKSRALGFANEVEPSDWPSPIEQIDHFLASCPAVPSELSGRGIVTSCGGDRVDQMLSSYVQFCLTRYLGCDLPIECWHIGGRERCPGFAELVAGLGVHCRDAVAEGFTGFPISQDVAFHPCNYHYRSDEVEGFSLKPIAILASKFSEVIWLDADCHPVISPAEAFDEVDYQSQGALFWQDRPTAAYHLPILEHFGIDIGREQRIGWETGQIVIDKQRHWRPLQLTSWFCRGAPHWFQFSYGDKDTFQAGWRLTEHAYWLGSPPDMFEGKAFLHYLADRKPFVLHRSGRKPKLRSRLPLADPLQSPPHRYIIQRAIREFNGWQANMLCNGNETDG